MALLKATTLVIQRGILQTTRTPFAGIEETSEITVPLLGNLTILLLVPTVVLMYNSVINNNSVSLLAFTHFLLFY